jgi:hypothetical protein
VTFKLPNKPLKPTIVNGVENFWIRVRIVAGDYGKEATYTLTTAATPTQPASYEFRPASFAPPVIDSLKVGYTVVFEKPAPDNVLTDNNFTYQVIKQATEAGVRRFAPFTPTTDKPSLYLGFVVSIDHPFPNRPLSLFVQVADVKYGENLVPLSPIISKRSTIPGSSVTHTFTLTNPAAVGCDFNLSLTGMRSDWTTTGGPQKFTLAAGASQTCPFRSQFQPQHRKIAAIVASLP